MRLRSFRLAAHVRQWQYWSLVEGAAVVAQKFSTVVLFAVVFTQMHQGQLHVPVLLAINVLIAGILVLVAQAVGPPLSIALLFAPDPLSGLGHAGLLLSLLLLMSPILHTLTRAVAEDSVWALAIALALVHLAAFDYAACHKDARDAMAMVVAHTEQEQERSRRRRALAAARARSKAAGARDRGGAAPAARGALGNGAAGGLEGGSDAAQPGTDSCLEGITAARAEEPSRGAEEDDADTAPIPVVGAPAIGGALSLNAAMLGAVLLASRLPGPSAVFALLTVASQLFTVLPLCTARLRTASLPMHIALSVAQPAITLCALVMAGATAVACAASLGSVAVVVLIAPAMLLSKQPHKRQIQGPWDIATVQGVERM